MEPGPEAEDLAAAPREAQLRTRLQEQVAADEGAELSRSPSQNDALRAALRGGASASVPVPGLGGPARGAWVQATEGRSGAAVGPTSDGRLVVAWDLPPPQTSDNVSARPAAAIQMRGGEHLVSVELSEARDNVKLVVLNKSGEAWRWAREI
jgi:hypothetical protein